MKFSTRSTYGLRALTNLAKNFEEGSVPLSKIADDEKISLGYLERIFSKLKKAGIIESIRGANGGYRLSKKPSELDVYEIVKILEGNFVSFHCVDEKGNVLCGNEINCGAAIALSKIQKAINSALTELKLSELVK